MMALMKNIHTLQTFGKSINMLSFMDPPRADGIDMELRGIDSSALQTMLNISPASVRFSDDLGIKPFPDRLKNRFPHDLKSR